MPTIKPYETKKLPIKGDTGNKVVELSFKGNYEREKVKQFIQKFSDDRKKKGFNGEIQPVLRYNKEKKGWRSGWFVPVGKQVHFYEDDYERIDHDEDAP